jgi:hypothetical protein
MKIPKTAKGYISLMKKLEKTKLWDLKGYSSLPVKEQEKLILINSEISNQINQ